MNTERQIRLRGFEPDEAESIAEVLSDAGIRTENIDIVQEVETA
jgi:hypothetical protein